MTKKSKIDHYSDKEALDFHIKGKSGKIEINSSKPLTTKRDLSLAYSPGVAAPVKEIAKNPDLAYDYTSKGNLVAVISNGSAILGLGNLGSLASKPVMEGKSVLFKRFADIDSIDIEIDSNNTNTIIETIKNISGTFGGINLEDIAAPNCFIIERKLKEKLDIPVFHDDQHGTAIITTAALINALDISGKKINEVKVVINGAGASAIACANLFKTLGVKQSNLIMCDRKGVIYKSRDKVDKFKSALPSAKLFITNHHQAHAANAFYTSPFEDALIITIDGGGVDYDDGTDNNAQQLSADVTHFLHWAAEPEMEERKNLGIKVILFFIILGTIVYLAKNRLWRDVT